MARALRWQRAALADDWARLKGTLARVGMEVISCVERLRPSRAVDVPLERHAADEQKWTPHFVQYITSLFCGPSYVFALQSGGRTRPRSIHMNLHHWQSARCLASVFTVPRQTGLARHTARLDASLRAPHEKCKRREQVVKERAAPAGAAW